MYVGGVDSKFEHSQQMSAKALDIADRTRRVRGMTGYTKLFGSILASTIWREDDKTRLVWITILAMVNRNGIAEGSIPGLADMARVSVTDCEAALEKLQSPDKYSRSQEYEGRRITPVDGGWLVLNYRKYRDRMNKDDRREYNRLKQAECRMRNLSANVSKCQTPSALSAQAEATATAPSEAEAEANQKQNDPCPQSVTKCNYTRVTSPLPTELALPPSEWEIAPGIEIPGSLRTPEFLASIKEWIAHRKQMRGKFTDMALSKMLSKCVKDFVTPEASIAAIDHSIASGYMGVFPQNGQRQAANPVTDKSRTARELVDRIKSAESYLANVIQSIPKLDDGSPEKRQAIAERQNAQLKLDELRKEHALL